MGTLYCCRRFTRAVSNTSGRDPLNREAIKNAPSIPAWLSERLLNRQDTKKRDVERAAVSDKWFPGERNNRMASLAGTMRRRGCSKEAINAALRHEN